VITSSRAHQHQIYFYRSIIVRSVDEHLDFDLLALVAEVLAVVYRLAVRLEGSRVVHDLPTNTLQLLADPRSEHQVPGPSLRRGEGYRRLVIRAIVEDVLPVFRGHERIVVLPVIDYINVWYGTVTFSCTVIVGQDGEALEGDDADARVVMCAEDEYLDLATVVVLVEDPVCVQSRLLAEIQLGVGLGIGQDGLSAVSPHTVRCARLKATRDQVVDRREEARPIRRDVLSFHNAGSYTALAVDLSKLYEMCRVVVRSQCLYATIVARSLDPQRQSYRYVHYLRPYNKMQYPYYREEINGQ
jgi:hypothetical protein